MLNKIRTKFKELYQTGGSVYTSPGRINLIGEHTDYNGGFVFPGAIDKGMIAEIKLNGTNTIRAFALDLNESAEFGLQEADLPQAGWAKYIFGVCREITKRGGTIQGFDTVFAGDVPLGAGMSSSAALESTYAFALNDMLQLGIDKFELAKIGQATEHNYVGVKCGIMDQFASIFGKNGSLIRLDCRSLEYKYFPFNPKGYKLVLLDTLAKHELVDSPYNKRRESCERVAAKLNVEFLRDATLDMLKSVKAEITEEDYMRAEYVIEEIQRVLDVSDALEKGDYETVGQKMYETHAGMSKLYEVSCEELDYLNDIAKKCGVTGSRVMGGGFGGCTINLVKDELYDAFIKEAFAAYKDKFGFEPKLYDVVISDGARKIA
ncbi:galactokinase [Parabacteroides sp. OttesenSCG-928-G07]|nr:galactokinase [Parabacteroides sp. OttesenSCG-928-G07]